VRNDDPGSVADLDETVAGITNAASGVTVKIRSGRLQESPSLTELRSRRRRRQALSTTWPAASASTHRKRDVTTTALVPSIRRLGLVVMLFAPLLSLVCLSPGDLTVL
jgi:hypothetical protein